MLIAHGTDLSGEDDVAFEHAVALARAGGARLASVHACVGPAPDRELPHAGAGVQHERILHQCCDDPTDTLLDALHGLAPDLVVLATHARRGLARLLGGSVAEGVARNVAAPTLLLPLDGARFVDPAGTIHLSRVLLAASGAVEAQAGVDALALLTRLAGVENVEVVILHVGEGASPPAPSVPSSLELTERRAQGELEAAILDAAAALDVDLLVMPTRGHDSIGDVLVGSHTERVLHDCKRPVLWVPLAP